MSNQEPKCDKCGEEIITGLMAAFCPHGSKCELWPRDSKPETVVFAYELWEAQVQVNMQYVKDEVNKLYACLETLCDEFLSLARSELETRKNPFPEEDYSSYINAKRMLADRPK